MPTEERKNEEIPSGSLDFVRGHDSQGGVSEQRAAETDPEHSIAEC
jgi:hypothetical protein